MTEPIFPQLQRLPLYDAEKQAPPAVVCVTGASSYVAGSVIPRLLARGDTVHATVRDPSDKRKVAHLEAMDGGIGRLKLFKADLTTPGSFDAAVAGAQYVIHIASPVHVRVPRGLGLKLLIEPAVAGVENVLGSVAKAGSVEAVVLTGSVAAVFGDTYEKGKGYIYTEADWCETATDTYLPYNLSKTLAEKRAYELCEGQPPRPDGSRWRLVSILPSFVTGPPASVDIPAEGVAFMKDLLNGKFWPMFAPAIFSFIDIDDLAAAHVLAMVTPATGRFIVSAESASLLDWLRELRPQFPKYWIPAISAPLWLLWVLSKISSQCPFDMMEATYNKVAHLDHSKAERLLGLKFHSPKQALIDELHAIIAMGGVKAKT